MCFNGKTVLIEELNSTAIDFICFVNYLVILTPICFRFCYREIQIQLFFFCIVKQLLNYTILILFIWFVNLTLLCKSSWKSLNFLSILQNDQGCETQGTENVKGGINHYSWYQTLKRDDVLVKYKVWCEIINNQRAGELPWLTLTLMRKFYGMIIKSNCQIWHRYGAIFQTTSYCKCILDIVCLRVFRRSWPYILF